MSHRAAAWAAGLVAAGLLLAIASWLVAPDEPDVLRLPEAGSVAPAALPDGTPVLAVHDRTGRARVIEARSPVAEAGRRGLLGWCADGDYLLDPQSGLAWDLAGRPVDASGAGARVGEPAEQPRLRGRPVAERADARTVSLDEPAPLGAPGGTLTEPEGPGRCAPGELRAPTLPAERLAPAALAGDAADLPADGWASVDAALVQRAPGERPRLCARPDDAAPRGPLEPPTRLAAHEVPDCERAQPTALPPLPDLEEGHGELLAGPLRARLEDGAVTEVLVAPEATRARQPLEGTLIVTGEVLEDWPDGESPADDLGALDGVAPSHHGQGWLAVRVLEAQADRVLEAPALAAASDRRVTVGLGGDPLRLDGEPVDADARALQRRLAGEAVRLEVSLVSGLVESIEPVAGPDGGG